MLNKPHRNEKTKTPEVRAKKELEVSPAGHFLWAEWFITRKEYVIKEKYKPQISKIPVGNGVAQILP